MAWVDEGCEQDVCRLEGADEVGGEEGRETLLPGVVAAFDFGPPAGHRAKR